MLYTVYTVEITDNYKGENDKTIQICVEGGIAGLNDEKQYQLLQESGLLTRYGGIPIYESGKKLDLNASYLFCTRRSDGDYDFIVNMDQFAYFTDSASATQIKQQSMDN